MKSVMFPVREDPMKPLAVFVREVEKGEYLVWLSKSMYGGRSDHRELPTPTHWVITAFRDEHIPAMVVFASDAGAEKAQPTLKRHYLTQSEMGLSSSQKHQMVIGDEGYEWIELHHYAHLLSEQDIKALDALDSDALEVCADKHEEEGRLWMAIPLRITANTIAFEKVSS